MVSHRPYTGDLFNEFGGSGFADVPYIKRAVFMGYALGEGRDGTEAYVKAFNPIYTGDSFDAIFPIEGDAVRDRGVAVKEIRDDEKIVAMAQPGRIYLLKLDTPIGPDAVFRKRIAQ
jgi:hypothetical protein